MRKSIVALNINDKYCGVVVNKGQIELLKLKSDDHIFNFNEYLELSNELSDKYALKNYLEENIKKNRLLSTLAGSSLAISLLLLMGLFPSISVLNAFLIGMLGVSSLGVLSNSICNFIKEKTSLKQMSKQIRKTKKDIDNIKNSVFLQNEIVFEPYIKHATDDRIFKQIKLSIEQLYLAMEKRIDKNEGINKIETIYLDNNFISKEDVDIMLPYTDAEIEEGKKIVNDSSRKKSINELRSLKFQLLNDTVLNDSEKVSDYSNIIEKDFLSSNDNELNEKSKRLSKVR